MQRQSIQIDRLIASQIAAWCQNLRKGRRQVGRQANGGRLVRASDVGVDEHSGFLLLDQKCRNGEPEIAQADQALWRNALGMGSDFAVENVDLPIGETGPEMVVGAAISKSQFEHWTSPGRQLISNVIDAGALRLHAVDKCIQSAHEKSSNDPAGSARVRDYRPAGAKAMALVGRSLRERDRKRVANRKIYPMTPDTTAPVIVSLLAVGMALAFILADRRSITSQALSLFLLSVGISIAIDVLLVLPMRRAHGVAPWEGLMALPEVMAILFAYEWVVRVRRTIPSGNLNTRGPDRLLRGAQAMALFYGLAAIVFPKLRAEHFGNLTLDSGEKLHPSFWLFSIPLGLSLVLGTAGTLFTLNRRPDRAEGRRLIGFAIGAPIMAASIIVPSHLAPLCGAVGLLVLLVGSVQYHVAQGQRAQFLSRFLSPQVAELVTRRGLKSATEEKTLELSVVCCDLRGFTAFSAATSSRRVIDILREYYDAVGSAAAACGGTIKDQAGDGVLILVGAPIAFADHAQRALELARQIRNVGVALTARWSNDEMQLGVGVGVASGYVTVGVIGGASRLEYTAVGSPVNLASRLCSEATHAEVLVDGRTTELLGTGAQGSDLRAGLALQLKGFSLPMQSYVLQAA